MKKTYHADQAKANKLGYSGEYTWITVENGEVVGCARGNHYAGCSCIISDRATRCTDENAAECVRKIIGCLSEDAKIEIGEVKIKERSAAEYEAQHMKEIRTRAVNLKETIETACRVYGMNLTIHEGKIGFVDPGSKRIVMLWGPEYKMN